MGSCVSTADEDQPPPMGRTPQPPRSRRCRSENASVDAATRAAHTKEAAVPGCVVGEPDEALSQCGGIPVLEPFDVATCPPAARPWFDALCSCELTDDRRRAIHSALGHTAKQQASLRGAPTVEINGAFFSGVHDSVVTLDALFDECRIASAPDAPECEHDTLDAGGIEALGARLGVSDLHVLYLVHCMSWGEGPWSVQRRDFREGCMRLLVTSSEELVARASMVAADYEALTVQSPAFGGFYRFLFGFVNHQGARCMPAESAVGLWESVLVPKWAGGEEWVRFVKATAPEKPVFRDLWMQLGFFASAVTWPGCPEADDDTSWPSLIDSFLDHVRHPPAPAAAE